jgi:hypothetical protein
MKCPKCQGENPQGAEFCGECGKAFALLEPASAQDKSSRPPPTTPLPASCAHGRYQVKEFLGEGGKKKVYLAHDTVLDRDVAFYLIKTEDLDYTESTAPMATAGCREDISQ